MELCRGGKLSMCLAPAASANTLRISVAKEALQSWLSFAEMVKAFIFHPDHSLHVSRHGRV